MITNPWIHRQLTLERQRNALARAEEHRLVKAARRKRPPAGPAYARPRRGVRRGGACARATC